MQLPPPAGFESLKAFVNTKSFERGTDELSDPRAARAWLVEHGLLRGAAALDERDVERLVKLREALRRALLAHHEREEDPAAAAALDSLAESVALRVGFGPSGETLLEPAGDGVDEALGRVLAIVHRAMLEGTWERMKACPADDCLWAFYDHSKNRSAKWCSMEGCGNRMKARAYRARHA